MENKLIQNGWKKLTSDSNYSYLYKGFKVGSMTEAVKIFGIIAPLVLKSGVDKTTQIALSSSLFTVSINTASNVDLNNKHYEVALKIEEALA